MTCTSYNTFLSLLLQRSFDSSGDERYCSDEEVVEPAAEMMTQQSSPAANVKHPFITLTAHKGEEKR